MQKVSYYHVVNGDLQVWKDKVTYLLNRGAKAMLVQDELLEFKDCYERMLKEPEHQSPEMQDYILKRIMKFEKHYGIKVERPTIDTNKEESHEQENEAKG